MKMTFQIMMTLCCGLVLFSSTAISQDLPDTEIQRLFNAVVHPDSPNAPLDIESVNGKRQMALGGLFKELFDGAGPTPEYLHVFEDGILTRHDLPVSNVQVMLEGEHSDKVILVGAHLDVVPKRSDHSSAPQGVIDDWSGAVMLVKLYEHLKQHSDSKGKFHHTFVFVGFAYEESGLWGSETYVQELRLDNRLDNIKAMVNLECLGVSDLFTWDNGSTDWLEELAVDVANDLPNVSLQRRMLSGVGADSVPFILAGRPAITIDSLSSNDFGKIHTPDDNKANINNLQFRKGFEFTKKYLRELDSTLAAAPQLADIHAPLPESFASFNSENPLRRISWEPTNGSIISTANLSGFAPREVTFELQFKEAIETANERWLTAAAKGDSNSIAQIYSETAVIVPPDAEPCAGRQAIKNYYAKLFESIGGGIRTKFTSNSLRLSDNLAYERGTYRGNKILLSSVVWIPVKIGGQLSAQMHFDAWYENEEVAAVVSKTRLNRSFDFDQDSIQISEDIFAFREDGRWVIVAIKNRKAKKTPVSQISENFETDLFPRKQP